MRLLIAVLLTGVAGCSSATTSSSAGPQSDGGSEAPEGPLKHTPSPTSGDISAADLETRLYIFADDSMMGRDDGGPVGNVKGTAYIEREVRRLGLTPAGDNGTFFQDIGYRSVVADSRSSLTIDGRPLALGRDYAPVPRVGARPLRDGLQVVFGGTLDSTAHITREQANGKLVMLTAAPGGRGGRGGGRGGAATLPAALNAADAILVVQQDSLGGPPVARGLMPTEEERAAAGPLRISITRAAAQQLLGVDPASATPGATGRTVRLDVSFSETRYPVRNVVAVVPGTDRNLRSEYVALGAHSDHVGFNTRPVDHDSTRAYNKVMRPRGANDPVGSPTPEQWTRIKAIRDSLSRLHPARRDSINNGADDDGSGSVVLLEIAESMARGDKPKRSVVFVWHASEEDGLLGSRYFTDHPTVSRESIVAQLNTDMIGRGRATDHEGGGASYLRVIGSRRLSTQLGDLTERTNTAGRHGFVFDYSYDTPGHPLNAYCRSDHYNYARYGIPIVYFGTGVEADYHMVTDEPQYIDYPNMARRARFMRDLALAVGDMNQRPVVDKPLLDPKVPCRQ